MQAKQWLESALLVERVSGEMRPALDRRFSLMHYTRLIMCLRHCGGALA